MSVMVQNKYGEYKPLDNERVETSAEAQLEYAHGFIDAVNEAISDITNRFYFIGFRLDEANRYKYYEALGYSSIEELAEAEFGFQRASTYNYIKAFNYAKSKTPLYIEDKFRGYSYTALLEMSKAKTLKRYSGNEGIEHILTPKVSVSKIKQVRPLWNKYIEENGALPDCKTVAEFIALVQKPAPAPLLKLATGTEENPVQSIRLKEPEEPREAPPEVVECELIEKQEEPSADFVDGEDYSQYDDEPKKRPEAEIIKVGLTGVDIYVEDAKFRIYDRYRNEPLKGNFSEFIKGVYNYANKQNFTHGFYSKDDNMNRTYDNNGVQFISFDPYQKVKLTWEEAARQISDLIYTDEYLTEVEQEEYLDWKAKNEGLVVKVEDGRASTGTEPAADVLPISDKECDSLIKNLDELIEPKKKEKTNLLNLKNDKARKAWLDDFRAWGVWVDVPEVSKTFYRYNFANGCAVVVEVGIEYGDGYTLIKGAHELRKYSVLDREHPKYDTRGISYTAVIQWLSQHGKEV